LILFPRTDEEKENKFFEEEEEEEDFEEVRMQVEVLLLVVARGDTPC